MDKMLIVGLYQTELLLQEPDEYEGPDIDYTGLGIPDKRELKKAGGYVPFATTIDLTNVEYPISVKLGDIVAVKIVLKSGNSLYINATINDFDKAWMEYKALIHNYEFILEDLDEETGSA